MKRFGIILLIMITLVVQAPIAAYGENNTAEGRYQLHKEHSIRLRKEILELRNRLSEKKAEKIPVLMYHHILEQEDIDRYNWSNNGSVISVEAFEEQMDYLYENEYYTATLDELQSFLEGEITLPEKTVVITFDDGYLSNALYAYPIMQKYNFRGTIFMLGYRVDGVQVPFDPSDTQSLSIYEAYKYEDVFDYESHTYELHDVNDKGEKLLISSEEEIILQDLIKSKELVDAKYFAYPYGKYNENTIQYLKQTGYDMAFTIEAGYVTRESDKYDLPRFAISPHSPLSKFKRIVNGIENI
ncbi:polysaccharide deacetylase family protein [Schnuerera ultunensis]|uniref:polysaccharide deacetylase family protein n=1 Tax=Schnuerera ultunensis TaxID=45497 RepID=UPI000400D22F|nr:polysaccharide deacetylase family protein [Schnuerera ultunensis]